MENIIFSPHKMSFKIMSIDFPRAWQLAHQSKPEDHDKNCSYINPGGFLCDCAYLHNHPDQQADIFYGEGRRIINNK